jgi:FtsP/CotA-like multicopper oxidase with cupredoxin domain
MRPMNMKNATSKTQLFLALMVALTLMFAPAAFAAAPGITTTGGTAGVGTFNLTAQDAYLNQPDGNAVYSWGYGCASGSTPTFVPAATFAFAPACSTMQVPGPTMVVTEGQTVTVNLTNQLPTPAGNTSILFPGFNVCVGIITAGVCTPSAAGTNGVTGLLAQEAVPGGTVTYQFVASQPGTHAYYSGTQGDLQVEMGLYGAIIVLPSNPGGGNCDTNNVTNLYGKADYGTTAGIAGFPEQDFRLAHAAYDHPKSCYDREYLFQWAEMDSRIHKQALAQVQAKMGCAAGTIGCSLDVQTEPYHPAYFLINGRSMPDLMDPEYAGEYPHQPYNGNPHMHPGELTLIRTIGQGRWQHPFHEHANHVRILARDGNLILSPTNPTQNLAGSLMFNTDTTPGEAFDGIFYFSGRGLNWDPYGHHPAGTGSTTASFTITSISESANTVTATVGGTLPAVFATNSMVTIAGAPTYRSAALTVTSLSEVGNTVTATVSGMFGSTGGTVTIANASVPGYNGTFAFTTTNVGAATTTFTYTDGTTGLAAETDGVATATDTTPGYNGSFVVTSVDPAKSTFTYTDGTSGLASGASGTATVNLGGANNSSPTDPLASLPCTPDANGYNTGNSSALNYYEWCQDHNKPVQVAPFGDVASGGPATLPDPNVFTNGQWYGGTPYLGPDASLRASMAACDTTVNANCTTLLPSNTQANPANERGWAFMWHSHNEREITTNNVFPGGMLMMMLVDSREFAIDESQ